MRASAVRCVGGCHALERATAATDNTLLRPPPSYKLKLQTSRVFFLCTCGSSDGLSRLSRLRLAARLPFAPTSCSSRSRA